MERHVGISDYFFSNHGNKLQYYDSQIAEQILVHFAKQGIPCLPIHDSFIIDFRYAVNLQLKMKEIYKKDFGLYIDIKVDQAQFHMDFVEAIRNGLDSGVIPKVDRQHWQGTYDKLSKMDLILMSDRAIIPPKNE